MPVSFFSAISWLLPSAFEYRRCWARWVVLLDGGGKSFGDGVGVVRVFEGKGDEVDMSRLSFRPRPLDIHRKLPIVKSIGDFGDDEAPITATSTRHSQLTRLADEVQHVASQKSSQEIPTPQYNVVETYERDYDRSFMQPSSYLRGRGARAELGEFVEYDLDNEDEDWLHEFNAERKILATEKFEVLLFKLEVLDHKVRERAGMVAPGLGSPIPVLQFDTAVEALQPLCSRFVVLQSVYTYWKSKREQWQKPILRRLQPPPPVNDTNPYNVFRPREKAHRLHTRRMQRRENNVQSFEKLRHVRRNMDQAKMVLEALIKREEKKREVLENEVNLQRLQMKHKHEAHLVEDRLALPGLPMVPCRFLSSEDDPMDSDDTANGRKLQAAAVRNPRMASSRRIIIPMGRMKRDLKRRPLPNGWLQKRDPQEPVLLFTRPLDPDRLAAAGIAPPQEPQPENGSAVPPSYRFRGRVGRGGRIVFDRWNPLLRAPIRNESSSYSPQNTRQPLPDG